MSSVAEMMKQYCKEAGWEPTELDDQHVVLRFATESRRTQTLYIIYYESVLEFSVPSLAVFDSLALVPYYFSVLLLQRNARNKIGFWCIEEIRGKQVFSYMHNARLEHLTAAHFREVVQTCVQECAEFEGLLFQRLKE